jgi:electron transfer flavoprotein alpha subunit
MPRLLVVAETDGTRVLPVTMSVIAFAQAWATLTGGEFDIFLAGEPEIVAQAETLTRLGAGRLYVMPSHEHLYRFANTAEIAMVAAALEAGADSIAGAATQAGRDVLPRVASRMDLPMLSDVTAVSGSGEGLTFKRPMYAGNVIATVRIAGDRGVFTVRTTAFGKPMDHGDRPAAEIVSREPYAATGGIPIPKWRGLDAGDQTRPDLTGARVVVSGGRPLRDAATFERVIGGLADKLGGAVGATRAAVDAGIAPNELQVGQTGKIVAPELYIAAGISGSVQHLAGMKDSKVIVAINTDPEAPIFEVADFGLVADLHQAVPEMTAKL